jgi:hypothetical protein
MAQQTAVEWLFRQMTSTWYDTNSAKDILKQAKEMEKEQITFAYNDGADAIVANKYKSMEDYYNELYQSRQDKTDK